MALHSRQLGGNRAVLGWMDEGERAGCAGAAAERRDAVSLGGFGPQRVNAYEQ